MVTLKTDWVDGDYVYAKTTADDDGFNGITNEVNQKSEIHIKIYTSSAEDTDTTGSWVDSDKSFTLSAPVNSYIIGIKFKCQIGKITDDYSSEYGLANLKISGANLGTYYLVYDKDYLNYTNISTVSLNTSENYLFRQVVNDNYVNFYTSNFTALKILDTSTTFTVRIRGENDGVKIRNVEIIVMYATPVIED